MFFTLLDMIVVRTLALSAAVGFDLVQPVCNGSLPVQLCSPEVSLTADQEEVVLIGIMLFLGKCMHRQQGKFGKCLEKRKTMHYPRSP